MNFTMIDNQHGTLQADPVKSDGTPGNQTGQPAFTSSDPTVIAVSPNPGFPNQAIVSTQGKAGTATVTVAGKDEAGAPMSTTATFTVTGGNSVGYKLQLINVGP